MAVNEFLPFAVDAGANVVSQDEYLVTPEVVEGFTVGVLRSALTNKVWRQSSFVSAAIAQFIAQSTSQDVLDNGDLNGFVGQLIAALAGLGSAATSSVYVGDAPPPTPWAGQLWVDSTTCRLYFWFQDGTSNQWVAVNSSPAVSPLRTQTRTSNYSIGNADNGITYNNVGATATVLLTLPTASPGLIFGGAVFAPQYLSFKAAGSDVIARGSDSSAAAGYIRSNLPYSTIQLTAHTYGRWVVSAQVGTWGIDV